MTSTRLQNGIIEIRHPKAGPVLAVHGRFDWQAAMACGTGLLDNPPDARIIDMEDATEIDTVGALYLVRLRTRLGNDAEFINFRPGFARFLDDVARADAIPVPARIMFSPLRAWIESLGRMTMAALAHAAGLVSFLGELTLVLVRSILHPSRLRMTAIVYHMQDEGLRAVPIAGLLAVLLGVVLAFQGADQLRRFGATIFVVNLLGISILRELGAVVTSIVVAGRSGSSFTAEIGSMKINQEVDAMRTMGIDPMEALVLPRVLALVLTLPLLVFCSDALALIGGAAMARLTLGISIPEFLSQFKSGIPLHFLWVGLIKAPVFALVIGLVGCFQGLQVADGAESVGRHTTISVVQSISLIIVCDSLFSVIFALLHY